MCLCSAPLALSEQEVPFQKEQQPLLPKGDAKGGAHTCPSYARNVASQAEDQRSLSGGWGRCWLAGGCSKSEQEVRSGPDFTQFPAWDGAGVGDLQAD